MAVSGDESSLDDSRNSAKFSSSHHSQADDSEGKAKDELAVSRRGDIPPKAEKAVSGTASIEEQLKKLSTEEEKSWNYLDSVHSKNSYGAGGKYMSDAPKNNFNASDNSLTLDDSCASFASFGGSSTGDDDSASDILDQKAAFCNLEPEMTPRRKLLAARKPSTRMIRAPSYRGSNLQLIQESDDL
mmetsp:Transcript_20552/g.43068  ORF Transcript_20552/g.43068 Transcript_20552/m.43068 type:complete len:186 (-) Transcript_20552:1610-2167(-)